MRRHWKRCQETHFLTGFDCHCILSLEDIFTHFSSSQEALHILNRYRDTSLPHTISTIKWYSCPYTSPYPNMLSLDGPNSELLAGEGSSAARRPSLSNCPESFLDEISLIEHLTALSGSQCASSWVVAPVPKRISTWECGFPGRCTRL